MFDAGEDEQLTEDSEKNSQGRLSDLGLTGIIVGAVLGMVLIGAITLGVILPILNSRWTEKEKKETDTDINTLEEHDMAAIIVPSN